MREYKVLLAGSAGTGKTAFVEKLQTGNFTQNYIATLGVDVSAIQYNQVLYNIWDLSGQKKFSGLGSGYYTEADYAIIMYDDRDITKRYIESYIKSIRSKCPNIKKIITVGNKNDVKYDDDTFSISVKNDDCHKLESILEHLIE